jgi:hypothetical protein
MHDLWASDWIRESRRDEDFNIWRHQEMKSFAYPDIKIRRYENMTTWEYEELTRWRDHDYDKIEEITIYINWRIMEKNKI